MKKFLITLSTAILVSVSTATVISCGTEIHKPSDVEKTNIDSLTRNLVLDGNNVVETYTDDQIKTMVNSWIQYLNPNSTVDDFNMTKIERLAETNELLGSVVTISAKETSTIIEGTFDINFKKDFTYLKNDENISWKGDLADSITTKDKVESEISKYTNKAGYKDDYSFIYDNSDLTSSWELVFNKKSKIATSQEKINFEVQLPPVDQTIYDLNGLDFTFEIPSLNGNEATLKEEIINRINDRYADANINADDFKVLELKTEDGNITKTGKAIVVANNEKVLKGAFSINLTKTIDTSELELPTIGVASVWNETKAKIEEQIIAWDQNDSVSSKIHFDLIKTNAPSQIWTVTVDQGSYINFSNDNDTNKFEFTLIESLNQLPDIVLDLDTTEENALTIEGVNTKIISAIEQSFNLENISKADFVISGLDFGEEDKLHQVGWATVKANNVQLLQDEFKIHVVKTIDPSLFTKSGNLAKWTDTEEQIKQEINMWAPNSNLESDFSFTEHLQTDEDNKHYWTVTNKDVEANNDLTINVRFDVIESLNGIKQITINADDFENTQEDINRLVISTIDDKLGVKVDKNDFTINNIHFDEDNNQLSQVGIANVVATNPNLITGNFDLRIVKTIDNRNFLQNGSSQTWNDTKLAIEAELNSWAPNSVAKGDYIFEYHERDYDAPVSEQKNHWTITNKNPEADNYLTINFDFEVVEKISDLTLIVNADDADATKAGITNRVIQAAWDNFGLNIVDSDFEIEGLVYIEAEDDEQRNVDQAVTGTVKSLNENIMGDGMQIRVVKKFDKKELKGREEQWKDFKSNLENKIKHWSSDEFLTDEVIEGYFLYDDNYQGKYKHWAINNQFDKDSNLIIDLEYYILFNMSVFNMTNNEMRDHPDWFGVRPYFWIGTPLGNKSEELIHTSIIKLIKMRFKVDVDAVNDIFLESWNPSNPGHNPAAPALTGNRDVQSFSWSKLVTGNIIVQVVPGWTTIED